MPGKKKGNKPRPKTTVARDLRVRDASEDQYYGIAGRNYGSLIDVTVIGDASSAVVVKAHICGTMRKHKKKEENKIEEGSLVLISRRGFQDSKADIIHKYTRDEVRQLKRLSELPESVSETTHEEAASDEDCGFDFDAI